MCTLHVISRFCCYRRIFDRLCNVECFCYCCANAYVFHPGIRSREISLQFFSLILTFSALLSHYSFHEHIRKFFLHENSVACEQSESRYGRDHTLRLNFYSFDSERKYKNFKNKYFDAVSHLSNFFLIPQIFFFTFEFNGRNLTCH